MKIALLVAMAIVIFSSLPFVSRQTDAAAEENSPAQAKSAYVNRSPSANTQTDPKKLQSAPNRATQSTNSDSVGRLDSESAQPGAADLVNINKKAQRVTVPQAK